MLSDLFRDNLDKTLQEEILNLSHKLADAARDAILPIFRSDRLLTQNKDASGFSIKEVMILSSLVLRIPKEVASFAFTGWVAIEISALLSICFLIISLKSYNSLSRRIVAQLN